MSDQAPQPKPEPKPQGLSLKGRLVAMSLAAVVGVGVGLLGWTLVGPKGQAPVQQTYAGIADIGGPFALTTHTGVAVTDKTYEGQYTLLYFGYTFCPDVCPLGLMLMQDVMERLGPDAADIQPLFITVDPERDTPAVLKDFIEPFHPRLIALTGTPEAVAEVAAAYKMYYRRADFEGVEGYGIDHMNIFYLMGPDGTYVAHFLSPTSPKDVAESIRSHLN
jgi:protein SCO1